MLYGIDTSHWEPGVVWSVVAKTQAFGITKATEGLTGVDSLFHPYWNEIRQAGLVRGAYHFFHPNQDPLAQAEHFLKVVGPLQTITGDLPYILDWEVTGGVSPHVQQERALVFLEHVRKVTPGQKAPIIYASVSFFKSNIDLNRFKDYPIWVAKYGPPPQAPYDNYLFWQTSDKGRVVGVPQPCDINRFRGSLEQLKEHCV